MPNPVSPIATLRLVRSSPRAFCALAFGLLLLPACDRHASSSGNKKTAGEAAEHARKPLLTRIHDGYTLIFSGKYAEAAQTFGEIEAEDALNQPLANWVTINHGLAQLLAGHDEAAQRAWEKIEQRGAFGESEQEQKLSKFFLETASKLRSKGLVSPDVAKDYDKWRFEAYAMLLFAVKNWNLEETPSAIALFRQFTSSAPQPPVLGFGDEEVARQFKEMAGCFVGDYQEYVAAREALKVPEGTEPTKEALETAQAARSRMKLPTKLAQSIDAAINLHSPKIAALSAEQARMAAEDLAFDDKELPAARQLRDSLVAKYQFIEAKTAMLAPNLRGEKAKEEQALLAKKTQWLATFKTQLVEDLTTKGYAGPVNRKTGAPLTTGIVKADEQQIFFKSPRGPVAVAWGEIAPESVFIMGQSFISPDVAPELAAFRKWHLGVFGDLAGKKAESRVLLKEAAAAREVFADELPLFP